MKQKISVRAVIKQEGKVLLLRRAAGRESLRGLFELPGGGMEFGEAPELALRREVSEEVGSDTETVQLYDVLSEIDHENTDVQHVVIIYLVSLRTATSVTLSNEHDKYTWKKVSELQLNSITSLTALALNITEFGGSIEVESHHGESSDDKNTMTNKCIVYSDGGSRGNPGPSAAGFIIMNDREEVLFEGGKYLGITTNNQAEYQGVLSGLEKAREMGARQVEFRLDSLLVVNQMNGLYQIKNRDLWPIHERIKQLVASLESVRFIHVRREFNRLADGMVNKILDAEAAR
ncbi:MAG TPA: reverse transcriptase-like protein [Candidatus Saccharimonadales bacterium]|jgi:mutator protein MutT|nr:reverse transcriptase-like protein [Candidatus Saccharimonadales bacterium]